MVENKDMEELKEGWRRVKLGEVIVEYNNLRKPLSKNIREKIQGKYPYYGAQGIIDYIDSFILEGQYLLIAEDGNNLKEQKENIARIATGKFWVSNHAHIIKNNEKSNLKFLLNIINKLDIKPYLTGSVQPKLNKNNLLQIKFNLPPLETQEKIASILSALDDKIEINNEMNKTLEEMAQTLFKRWFIDFDFPNENGEPYRSSGGKMVDSELGEIPEGWEVTILGDLFKFVKGKKPKIVSESFSEETPLKYLTIKGFNGDENLYASEDKIILIDKKDIVMVMDGASSGDVYIGKSGVLGSTFSKIEKTKEINWSYIYLILKYYENDIKSHTTGSAIPHTDKGYVEKIRVSLPNLELLNFLSKELSGIIKRKLINQEEIQSLTEIRDILLPKLMNGEIEV